MFSSSVIFNSLYLLLAGTSQYLCLFLRKYFTVHSPFTCLRTIHLRLALLHSAEPADNGTFYLDETMYNIDKNNPFFHSLPSLRRQKNIWNKYLKS